MKERYSGQLEAYIEELEQRTRRLERYLCAAGVVCVLFASLAFTAGSGDGAISSPVQESIRAKSFLLVDDAGKVQGGLRFDDAGTPYVFVSSPGTNAGVRIAAPADGSPVIGLRNSTGAYAYRAELGPTGGAIVSVGEADGTPRILMSAERGMNNISLQDADGARCINIQVVDPEARELHRTNDDRFCRPWIELTTAADGNPFFGMSAPAQLRQLCAYISPQER